MYRNIKSLNIDIIVSFITLNYYLLKKKRKENNYFTLIGRLYVGYVTNDEKMTQLPVNKKDYI